MNPIDKEREAQEVASEADTEAIPRRAEEPVRPATAPPGRGPTAFLEPGSRPRSSPRSSSRSSPSSSMVIEDDDTISIVDLLENLSDHRWLFAAVTALCTLAALAYALLATPVYTVDALVQVEDKKGSALGALSSVAQALEVTSSPVAGEIEILRSRTNVAKAVEALRLQNEVSVANRLPVIGDWLARRLERDDTGLAIAPALPLLDTGNWAWGGERLLLAEFTVPPERQGLPYRLSVGEQGRWSLHDEEGALVLRGSSTSRAANEANGHALRIAELVARPGTEFEVRHHSLKARVDQVRRNLSVSETKRQSGIMRIEYSSADPYAAAHLVNAIAHAYLNQNVQRRSAEADNSLQFLEQQLPELRKQVDAAENALNAFRNEHRTIDIPGEISGLLTQSIELERTRLDLDLRRKEVDARYEPAHPVARALREQVARLSAEQQSIGAQIRSLPLVQQEYLRLSRDVEVNNQLYVSLLNNAQQLRIARAGTVANVSIVDQAIVPEKASKPRRAQIVAIGLLGGLAGGFLLAQLLAARRGRVRDPRDLEALLGIHVAATLPISPEQAVADARKGATQPFLLAHSRPTASAIEALRTLRLNLQLALAETHGGRTILLTSAIPGQGKSFVSANLAYLIANAGPRVLIIDADMRRSSIGRYFAIDGAHGLADILRDGGDPARFVKTDPTVSLSVLPAGPAPGNPGELLTAERLAPLFDWARANYDVVIIDAPPILPVSDAIMLGGFADIAAFVVRHKRVSEADVADAVQQYQLTGAPLAGLVFNCFKPSRVRYSYGSRYGYYGGKYGYGVQPTSR